MNVHLGPVLDEFVLELLRSGTYQTQSEVVREGLRLLMEREELKRLRLTQLRQEISIGISEAERGEVVDGPAVFSRIRKRSVGGR